MKLHQPTDLLLHMSEQNKDTQAVKDLAADHHPRPSQAEGDEKTIDEDLADKDKGKP